jgi:hypothetical protein
MAREVSERGLPSAEERRQILQRAGMILEEARDLMDRLDRHETSYPRSVREHQQVLERVRKLCERYPLSAPLVGGVDSRSSGQVLAA